MTSARAGADEPSRAASARKPANQHGGKRSGMRDIRGIAALLGRAHGEFVGAGADAAAQLRAQFLGDVVGIGAIADDLRPDEDDQLGSRAGLVLMREGVAESGNLVEYRDAVAASVLLLADQARQQFCLPGCDRDRALDPPFGDRRRQAGAAY